MLSPCEEGSSLQTAVEFETSNYFEGISLEHQWLEARYPGYQKQGQTLMSHGGKRYDLITIITADGEEKEVYFDIASFYGNW
jgi:hypothetical protein